MDCDTARIAGDLNRALEMEDVMTAHLVELLTEEGPLGELPELQRRRFLILLKRIQQDTKRHRESVISLLEALPKG
jgi:hypothetical protein